MFFMSKFAWICILLCDVFCWTTTKRNHRAKVTPFGFSPRLFYIASLHFIVLLFFFMSFVSYFHSRTHLNVKNRINDLRVKPYDVLCLLFLIFMYKMSRFAKRNRIWQSSIFLYDYPRASLYFLKPSFLVQGNLV